MLPGEQAYLNAAYVSGKMLVDLIPTYLEEHAHSFIPNGAASYATKTRPMMVAKASAQAYVYVLSIGCQAVGHTFRIEIASS